MPEYYIKKGSSVEAEGPFSVEKLREMAAAKKITPSTLHFYDDNIGWQPIGSNAALSEKIFDSGRKKLTLTQRPPPEDPRKPKPPPETTVQDILKSSSEKAAHEKVSRRRQWQERVATFSMPLLALLNIGMGALLIWSNYRNAMEILMQEGIRMFIFVPGILFGLFFVIMGFFLFLTVTAVYPAVRYASLALMAYFCVLAWGYLYEGLFQGYFLIFAGVSFGVGIFIATLTLNFFLFLVGIIGALLGLYAYGYFLFFL